MKSSVIVAPVNKRNTKKLNIAKQGSNELKGKLEK